MTLFFYIIIAIITFIAFLHAWAQKSYEISRTVVINKPKEEVYSFVRQLKNEKYWIPWFGKNFKGDLKFKGEDGRVDALLYWKKHNKYVEGTQKITKIAPGKIMETKLLFVKPFKVIIMEYKGFKELESNKTKMVWGFKGTHAFPLSIIAIFYPMDRAFGDDLDEGLKTLKMHLEKKKVIQLFPEDGKEEKVV